MVLPFVPMNKIDAAAATLFNQTIIPDKNGVPAFIEYFKKTWLNGKSTFL